MNTLFCLKDFHPSDIERFASCGMDNTVKIWSMKGQKATSKLLHVCICMLHAIEFANVVAEFWLYVDKSYSWTDLPSKFPTKYVQFPVC